jgi:hypothetical protein
MNQAVNLIRGAESSTSCSEAVGLEICRQSRHLKVYYRLDKCLTWATWSQYGNFHVGLLINNNAFPFVAHAIPVLSYLIFSPEIVVEYKLRKLSFYIKPLFAETYLQLSNPTQLTGYFCPNMLQNALKESVPLFSLLRKSYSVYIKQLHFMTTEALIYIGRPYKWTVMRLGLSRWPPSARWTLLCVDATRYIFCT